MKNAKRFMALVLALITSIALLAVPTSAVSTEKQQTVCMTKKNQAVYVLIYNMKPSQTIKRGSIKSSNSSVLAPSSLSYSLHWDESLKGKSKDKEKSCYINLIAKKPGTAKISYTIGKKTYTTTVKVTKYSNPIKTFKFENFKSGKNLASAFKNDTYGRTSISNSMKKKGNIVISCNSGWKVRSIEFRNSDTGKGRTCFFGWKGVSTAKMPMTELMKYYFSYEVSIELYNSKLKESQSLYYDIVPKYD